MRDFVHDLAVVGAGPYGLSIAAHAAAAGLDTRVFGRPMASWRDHMPEGMFLKSEPGASNLSDPARRDTLAAFCAGRGLVAEHGGALPLDTFTDYGLWFAERLPLPVEERTVTGVAPAGLGFVVTLEGGETLCCRAVALAVGVLPFARRPAPLRGLPPELASHSSDHRDLSRFLDTEVAVVGAGQAALETAALLAEAGARPTVVARAGALRWNAPPSPLRRAPWASLTAPHSALGTGWPSWVWSELPWAVRHLPESARVRVVGRALGPAGAWWLRERFESAVPVRLGRRLLRAVPAPGGGLRMELAKGAGAGGVEVVEAGHVIAATGFEPDLRRLTLLDPALRERVTTVRGTWAPALGAGFGASVPGLFFAGLPTAPSFGPAMRFVAGAPFTAERLVRGVCRWLEQGARPARGTMPRPGRVRSARAVIRR
ncbi:NAD(P)-binding domain-containing protein [Streptomyces radicis]|uniref:Dimethylaniline monooxygenase n=1 Tax=Streptomyces radicis TaxID=1750517 RepID=A0A3A9WDC5_9ACTN|nr:NAD(P)-binding domain-containing protein [Streptomyces radicis]RKN11341.1 dimethylaniline monooxygenase [Streptomyces radicis]RKN26636.1 dimethylaniline monooxygenase [Streptomyces radicis]